MGIATRILVLLVALGAAWWIIRRVRSQRLSLGTAVLFLAMAVSLIVLGLGADALLDPVSTSIGISYPPTLLFLISSVVLLVLVVHLGGKVEKLNEQVRDLAERYARDHATAPPADDARDSKGGLGAPANDGSAEAAPDT